MSEKNQKTEKEYVLVTEYFHPDTASTGQLMTDLAVGLQERGLDMTVYTGQPNYYERDTERQPTATDHEGVSVRRIRAPQLRQSGHVRRGLNWLIFTAWMTVVLLLDRPDRDRELIFVSNPAFLPLAMWVVHRLRGWEFTYIVYDLYPDCAVESGYFRRDGLLDRVWAAWHRRVFRDAAHVVAIGPTMRDRIVQSAGDGFQSDKVEVIHNWADGSFIEPVPKEENWFCKEHNLVDRFVVLYSGNMGIHHDLETVVRAAAKIEDEDVVFLLIGEGVEKSAIVDLAERLGVRGDAVQFLPFQPLDNLPYSLTAGDVSLVPVKAGYEGLNVSSKLYTSMAAGLPLLVLAQSHDDEARIVETYGVGKHVPQGDVDRLVEAIEDWRATPALRERQARRARDVFESHFTKERSVEQYYQMLTDG